jgi:hypothetical protein
MPALSAQHSIFEHELFLHNPVLLKVFRGLAGNEAAEVD